MTATVVFQHNTELPGLSVRGPSMPLRVQLGASVTLPCSVDTPIPLRELEVLWTREDSGSLVHLFLGGKIRTESQSPAYSGRAEFFTEEISKGNFSLLLRNVTTEDRGMYKCVIHTEQESSETNVTIDSERLVVTGADVPVFAYAGEDVILNCSVDTHVPLGELEVEWMKTNEEILVLLFMEGRYRPESQPERFRGRAEFFSEEIPKGNFSMKLRDIKTEDRGEFISGATTVFSKASNGGGGGGDVRLRACPSRHSQRDLKDCNSQHALRPVRPVPEDQQLPACTELGASVTLPCSVDTPIPLHELEVLWMRDSGSLVHLFLGRESRPESQSPAYSGRAEFFTEEISKGNFSLLLRNVTTEDKGMYKCVVHTEQESSEANVTIDTGK
ncbi:putative butyrophilin-like protein 10 [Conger conger]|uniref:putative butyrophilin-like protein 10 n=1 Tax=Conger conger TaxID=82655 RepID=UPI002A59D71C|nr:putative butyrophilin-like protein 10 [Conger conger]